MNYKIEEVVIGKNKMRYTKPQGKLANIILLHGNSSSLWSFHQQLQSSLAQKYSLYAIELPGHGETPPSEVPNAYSVPYYCNLISEFISKLNIKNPIMAGHSLGGHLALQTIPYLDSYTGVFIWGLAPLAKPLQAPQINHKALNSFFKGKLSDEEVNLWVKSCFHKNFKIPNEMYQNIKKAEPQTRENLGKSIFQGEYLDEFEIIKNLHSPFGISHAEDDEFFHVDEYQNIKTPYYYNNGPIFFKNSGHYLHIEKSQEFNSMFDLFIENTLKFSQKVL